MVFLYGGNLIPDNISGEKDLEMNNIVRVGVMNNFNMSKEEFVELNEFRNKYPNRDFFVNSNVKSLRDNPPEGAKDVPVIVTLNPDLVDPIFPDDEVIRKYRIKAFRVKIWGDFTEEHILRNKNLVDYCLRNGIKILLTFQRFRSYESFRKYDGKTYNYEWRGGYFRPTKEYRRKWRSILTEHTTEMGKSRKLLFECDKLGKGCTSCNNCGRLVIPDHKFRGYMKEGVTLSSLNLRTSGKCPYNCPDCFAKRLLMGGNPRYNQITQNDKQKGKTE